MANADIAVLTSDMKSGAGVVKRLSEYRINAVSTFGEDHRRRKMGFYMGDSKVKATTLHSFKGWESRLLVVYVTDAAHAERLALIYTELTRLKRSQDGSWLTVVCSASQLQDYGQTFPEFVKNIAEDNALSSDAAFLEFCRQRRVREGTGNLLRF